MKRRLFSIVFFLVFALSTYAQIPAGYYDNANGKTGAALKTALFNIIKTHTVRTYTQLWTDFQTTDKRPDGYVWDMYSDIPNQTPPYEYTFITNQCGNYSAENNCYNREHSFPNSWFGGVTTSPMYTDLFHLYPTDGWVNNKRSNYIYGEVQTPSYTSLNGSMLGSSDPSTGFSGTVFEPIDEYKGDFARSYFYMATCYEDKIASWTSYQTEALAILDGTSYPAFKSWYVQLLLKWNTNDPVSQKEIDRNNAVYSIQGNRNPFIDHPEFVNAIWNPSSGVTELKNIPLVNIYPNPAKGEINVEVVNGSKAKSLTIVNVIGNNVLQQQYDGTKQVIDISKLSPGVYFVNILGDNFKNTARIVVY